jgi:hypothetical protein
MLHFPDRLAAPRPSKRAFINSSSQTPQRLHGDICRIRASCAKHHRKHATPHLLRGEIRQDMRSLREAPHQLCGNAPDVEENCLCNRQGAVLYMPGSHQTTFTAATGQSPPDKDNMK